jgi:hypothetical protein
MISLQQDKQVPRVYGFTQQLLIPAQSRFLVWGTASTPILPASANIVRDLTIFVYHFFYLGTSACESDRAIVQGTDLFTVG